MTGFPTSSMQQRLVARERSDRRVRLVLQPEATHDLAEWQRRLDAVVAQHEALRTRLEVPAGLKQPVQIIDDASRVELSLVDGRLQVSAPAALVDAQSMIQLAIELEGGPADDPMQYADAAEWLNELLDEPEGAEARALWKSRDAEPAAELLFETGERTCSREIQLPEGVGDADVVAALSLVVARLDESRRSRFGIALRGRFHEDLEDAIGRFARWAVLPAAPDLQRAVSEHRRWADAELQEARDLQPQITHASEARDPALLLGFEDHGALKGRVVELDDGGWNASVVLTLVRRAGSTWLRAESTHPTALLEQVLAAIEASPETRACDVNLVPAEHREQLAQRAGRAHAPEPERLDVAFERVASEHADAVFVSAGEDRATYSRTRARADAIAAALIARGVERGDRVALGLSRSPDMVACILAVWKVGAAYVPIDPAYPEQRIRYLLDDSRARVAVTDASDARFPEAIVLTDVGESSAVDSKGDVDDVAYVIYTSGSTGRPKGVEVTHRTLHASTASRLSHYGGGPGTFLLLSSYAFDSSVAGIFWTLTTGGTLVLPAEGEERDPEALSARIEREGVTSLLTLPSLYALLLEHANALGSLKTAIVAGEACPRTLVERHFAALPECTLHNEYGPTEATVWSSVWKARVDAPVTIGGPVDHAELWVVDPRGELAPVGACGELWIGGRAIARGYLARPELSAERFIDNPFGEGRLYRSGDRVRWIGDELEFLGRVDDQVKVRGFRVELGEIETALTELAGVREAAATVRGEAESARLVGYLVSDEALDTEALRGALSARLPAYMIPTLVRVDDLPRTPNGKVDRDALPHPDHAGRATSTEYVAPRDPVDEVVAGIWGQILGTERVGIHDDFFELGGTSLVVTQVVARVRQAFRIDIPLRVLFDHPRVGALVDELRKQHGARMDKLAPVLLELARASEADAKSIVEGHST